ncbi:hypothetical protein [Rodentibacter genomosp. 2]|uniref:Uncharacterized protein n=1 Tax=Rodentibacter genomosp. 2 TaxID=1908266 RepID=A0A1V3JB17_9PAST|nr:hypothetical protein [Rodentibacter genomosp. 2]OOF53588.1 hypothetical protein BKK55_11140 [Rodentibacter genomosp. 2]
MKKSTADMLAYEFAKANYDQAGLNFHINNAKTIANFIAALSAEFQDKLVDFDNDTVERFKNLSK